MKRPLQALAGLALLTLVAWLALGRESNTTRSLDTIKLRITPYLGYGPYFIARAESFFEDEGLDVQFVEMTSAAEAVPALARGDLDVASGAISPGMLNAMAKGERIRFVASQTTMIPDRCSSTAVIAGRAFAESGALKDPAKLRGARVGTRQAFATAYFLERTLAPLGLTLSDVQMVEVPETIVVESLQAGRIDLALVGEPWLTRAVSAGAAVLWKGMAEVLPGFEVSVVAYGPRLLENRDLGNRSMTAYLRGMRQFDEGKTARNVEILAAEIGLDPSLLREACWSSGHPDARLNTASVLEFQSWMFGATHLDRSLQRDELFDDGFVEHANRMLFSSTQ